MSEHMRAMVLEQAGSPLVLRELPLPEPGAGQIRVRVEACGVCRTDLHIVDGELPARRLPLIPGHEVVGRIDAVGDGVTRWAPGSRVGIPWLGRACGRCDYCRMGRENLCDAPEFTGWTVNGGYAEYTVADAAFVYALPEDEDPVALAPLLCAGLIGFRSLVRAGQPLQELGLYGFGAAAHILCQLASAEGIRVYAFTRDGDEAAQRFARELGAVWAGGSSQRPPVELDAAILFAPVGALVPQALRCVRKGGRVVCGGIHMSDIPGFPYADLWGEREIVSVANLTRADGQAFFPRARAAGVRTRVRPYPLEQANRALDDLRAGRLEGAAVLLP